MVRSKGTNLNISRGSLYDDTPVWVGDQGWKVPTGRGPYMGGCRASGLANKFEKVQMVVTWGQTDRQTRLKTLPSHNFIGRR